MFSLQNQTAKLTSVNPAAEIHGADRDHGRRSEVRDQVPNDVLSEFDPSLKSALYRKPDESDSQAELAIDDPATCRSSVPDDGRHQAEQGIRRRRAGRALRRQRPRRHRAHGQAVDNFRF